MSFCLPTPKIRAALAMSLLTTLSTFGEPPAAAAAPWVPDLGDGTYKNPVLFADYSDPDAVRVGDDYYLVSSSFLSAPGLPILHSKDLVNWRIINHVFAQQPPIEHFSLPRHGQGVWAPAIRHHDGKFWIFYPDPDFGLYVTTATDPAGKWSEPFLFKPGKGLIDPCPLWDDDGQLYLVHGWAKSRAGISNLLTVHKLSADAHQVLDEGKVIIDANKMEGWTTLEGPKFYKRGDYYWIFAPAGGVATGYQAVFRSKSIYGPYESRVVLEQGKTAINGPHQGAWVDTSTGEDWFLHFQDRDTVGRVVHLQPMKWREDGWPVMGDDLEGDGKGEPVLTHKKPNVGRTYAIEAPQTSDEFEAKTFGLQWQWNANPKPTWASLTARPGFLRLTNVAAPTTRNDGTPAPRSIYDAPNFLLQKFPAPNFTVTTSMQIAPKARDDRAGLVVFGYDYAVLGMHRTATGMRLELTINHEANKPGSEERDVIVGEAEATTVYLRVTVKDEANCQFSYSYDNKSFTPVGPPFKATVDRWVGAKVGLVATTQGESPRSGHADFDWFRVTP